MAEHYCKSAVSHSLICSGFKGLNKVNLPRVVPQKKALMALREDTDTSIVLSSIILAFFIECFLEDINL